MLSPENQDPFTCLVRVRVRVRVRVSATFAGLTSSRLCAVGHEGSGCGVRMCAPQSLSHVQLFETP